MISNGHDPNDLDRIRTLVQALHHRDDIINNLRRRGGVMTESAGSLLARLLWLAGVTVSRGKAQELAYALITVMEEEGYSIVASSEHEN